MLGCYRLSLNVWFQVFLHPTQESTMYHDLYFPRERGVFYAYLLKENYMYESVWTGNYFQRCRGWVTEVRGRVQTTATQARVWTFSGTTQVWVYESNVWMTSWWCYLRHAAVAEMQQIVSYNFPNSEERVEKALTRELRKQVIASV